LNSIIFSVSILRFGNDELYIVVTGTKSDLKIKMDLENVLGVCFKNYSYFQFSIYQERPQFYNIDKTTELMIRRIWEKQKKSFEEEKSL
jgi:hypothetical protein